MPVHSDIHFLLCSRRNIGKFTFNFGGTTKWKFMYNWSSYSTTKGVDRSLHLWSLHFSGGREHITKYILFFQIMENTMEKIKAGALVKWNELKGLYQSLGGEQVDRLWGGERSWHVQATARILGVWNTVNDDKSDGRRVCRSRAETRSYGPLKAVESLTFL